jgi:sn-glycerol 3-phosphate transport system permease protein
MIETRQTGRLVAHFLLIVAVIAMGFPLYYTFIASTHTSSEILSPPLSMLPGSNIAGAYGRALSQGSASAGNVSMTLMLWNSLVMALAIAIGKIVISMLSAYAIVFFRFPLRLVCFWMIFITLMLPVEVRIVPTYQVIVSLGLLDTYAGLTVPLMASATATFLFRQFFMTIPDELVEAARLDGAGAMRFFKDILLPLSRTNIAALFVVTFIYGWTQYLWPLLVTTDPAMGTIIVALKKMVNFSDADTPWDAVMATAILALLPPVAVIVGMQKLFVKGLVETEK